MIDVRSGDIGDTPEQDAARVAQTEAVWLGRVVARLMQSGAMEFPASCEFLKRADLMINVMHDVPNATDIARIKEMAWKWRRSMPAHAAPKLPPHDPIVREQGLA
jgi:hypothetical protein